MIRLAIDLIFGVAIALAIAYGLASVLRGHVTWWQVLIVGVVVWILGTVAWWRLKRRA